MRALAFRLSFISEISLSTSSMNLFPRCQLDDEAELNMMDTY